MSFIKIKYCFVIITSLIAFEAIAAEEVIDEKIFGNISIKEIRIEDDKKIDEKLTVQTFTNNLVPTEDEVHQGTFLAWHPHYSKPILEISNNMLPITEHDCFDIDATLCSDNEHLRNYWAKRCNSSCLVGGAQFLAYDKIAKVVYFGIPTTFSGTAGQMYFIFSVNLADKRIKLLMNKFGIHETSLSPSGRYLAFSSYNTILIYDIKTQKYIGIDEDNIYTHGKESLHYLGYIKWINDSTFTYQHGTKHDKFQESFDEVKIVTYDINQNAQIASRTLPRKPKNDAPI